MVILEPGQNSYEEWRVLLGVSDVDLSDVSHWWIYYDEVASFITLEGSYLSVSEPYLNGIAPGDYLIAFELIFRKWQRPSAWYVQIVRVLPQTIVEVDEDENDEDQTDDEESE